MIDLERWPCRKRWRHAVRNCSSSDCCETVSDILWRRGERRVQHSSSHQHEDDTDGVVARWGRPCCRRWPQNPSQITLALAAGSTTSHTHMHTHIRTALCAFNFFSVNVLSASETPCLMMSVSTLFYRFRCSIMRINLSIHLRYCARLSWFSFSFIYSMRVINNVNVN